MYLSSLTSSFQDFPQIFLFNKLWIKTWYSVYPRRISNRPWKPTEQHVESIAFELTKIKGRGNISQFFPHKSQWLICATFMDPFSSSPWSSLQNNKPLSDKALSFSPLLKRHYITVTFVITTGLMLWKEQACVFILTLELFSAVIAWRHVFEFILVSDERSWRASYVYQTIKNKLRAP